VNQENIRNNTVTEDPTTPQVCRQSPHYVVKCQCLKSTAENKTSVTDC